ncbi:MAG TPA: hypothetical protein VFZ59_05725, partial [Verrucomicrobiae bacterium]|nr:hypothetical protein [Verrucomicrobiae bacterium]
GCVTVLLIAQLHAGHLTLWIGPLRRITHVYNRNQTPASLPGEAIRSRCHCVFDFMGAIKDLVDLVTKLSDSVQDRKFAAELREIQRMIGSILSEHAELHESRIALMTDNEKLKKDIPALKARISELEKENFKLLDPPNTAPPSEEDIALMRLLVHPNAKIAASSLAKSLNVSLPLFDYKADLLRSAGFIYVHHNGDFELRYSLSKKGQKFLFEKGLLG